ncbi:HdeD family acid-resistance protein [Myxococcus fulvus]|uniref:HdeD family acid-resistance protein n=1 Tax=Myxococcus fulvus TaxID=33 RepID=UPI003B9B389D
MDTQFRREPISGEGGRAASAAWGPLFVLGVLMAILGLVALGSSFITSMVSVILFGALLAGTGIAEIVSSFRVRKSGGPFWLYLLNGVLSTVVGIFVLMNPAAGLGALTLLLAGYFFASGLFHVVTSLMDRYPKWGWDFAYGAISIALGVIIMAQWPISAVWLVGTLVGISILMRGIALMAGSLELRRAMRGVSVSS